MRRSWWGLVGLGLSLQGVLLWHTGIQTAVPVSPSIWHLPLAILILTGLVAVHRRERPAGRARRFALALAAGAQVVCLGLVAVPRLRPAATDSETAGVRDLLAREASAVAALPGVLDQAAALLADCPAERALLADPFAAVQQWRRAWTARPAVAMALWAGEQRIGWTGDVVLAGPPPPPGVQDLVAADGTWVLRKGVQLAAGPRWRGELQIVLRRDDDLDRQVVYLAPPARPSVVVERGRDLVVEAPIGPLDAGGRQAYLRLSVGVPTRAVGPRLILFLLATAAAGALAAAGAFGGTLGLVAVSWLVRGLWAVIDAVRWWTAAFPGPGAPAAPTDPASLVDPAYFATTFAGGWFASGADAVLTGLLVAATAAVILRRLPSIRAASWAPVAVVVGATAGASLLGLRLLGLELTSNANARLIGLEVPYDSWTFWALHISLLLIGGSAAAVVIRLAAARALAGGGGRLAVTVALAAAVTLGLWRLAAPDAGSQALLAGGAAALLVGLGRAWRAPWRPGRPSWVAAGLLLVVTWNYLVLADAYGRAEREWLRRKAEQIVQPQADWIGFLLEDVLAEMAAAPAAAPASPAVEMWEDARAYRLWRDSAVRDLGMPGLVEVLGSDGQVVSLFATGFLRDFGYEVTERGEWRSRRGGVRLQDEVRRYPTGQEQILRGEIPRQGEPGWLRVELPVLSRRLSTLLASLGVEGGGTGDEGYRPRREVDRPVLLLRGDSTGWLDVGFTGLPAPASEPVIAALKAGQREWGSVEHDGARWLCRWAPLPAGLEATPGEGFLIGLQRPGITAVLLDWARVVLLNVLLVLLVLLIRAALTRQSPWPAGFQGRFLAGYVGIGLVLLLLAGGLADRLTFERLENDARERTRDGLVTTLQQLRGLLAEQARALAGSDYIAELLVGRLAGQRPQGPYSARQGMVFGPDGALLLDETLSDLDPTEAATLVAAAREASLVVMVDDSDVFLGTAIPIDLSGVLPDSAATGTFFYRQRLDPDLLSALADVVGAELTLRLDGAAVAASHPGRLFAGETPLLADPTLMAWLQRHPTNPYVYTDEKSLAFAGGVALPALTMAGGTLQRRILPAVLTVDLPDRGRDLEQQRRRTALFLAGLTTLLLLAAFALAAALTWNIFEPLRVLLRATQHLAAGEFDVSLPPPGRDEVGQLADGFRAMRDELQGARERLETRERFLAAVLERVPVGVLVWDANDRLVTLNPAAGGILAGFYPGEPASAGAEHLRRALAATSEGPEVEITGGGGRRTLRVRRAPLAQGTLAVCEDLSEFLATKRMALNAELARQVAHEIKNPLTPIQLSAQLVQQAHRDHHPEFDTILEDAIARILGQVTLLRSIAGEFSLLGRPGELDCVALDLQAVVADVAAGYRPAGDGTGPHVEIDPAAVPPVRGHRESLVKVLGNLMQNSLEAAGGPRDLRVSVSWRVEPRQVELIWRDNGAGIPPDVAERLFDPYFSTKNRGTGLGLAICRNLLDKMGGHITLANRTDGPGAAATLTLERI